MEFVAVGAALALLTVVHFMVPQEHAWHGVHILLEKLYYPLLLLAARSGLPAAGGSALLASLMFWGFVTGWRDPMLRTEMSGEILTFWFVALTGGVLMEQLRRAHHKVQVAHRGALEALAAAVDLRERETGAHCTRVQAYARLLAERVGYPPSRLQSLLSGALLHDIGKIGIPDAILLKAGPLAESEREVMHEHPRLGLDLVGRVDFLQDASRVVGSHHERWDGRGYPQGLAGDGIPLEARLFSIVDVFDALTSPRPYREPMSAREAMDYVREQAGTQFDPELAAAFCEIPLERLRQAAGENGLDLQV